MPENEITIFKKGSHLLPRGHVALYALTLIDYLQLDFPIIMLGAVLALGRSR